MESGVVVLTTTLAFVDASAHACAVSRTETVRTEIVGSHEFSSLFDGKSLVGGTKEERVSFSATRATAITAEGGVDTFWRFVLVSWSIRCCPRLSGGRHFQNLGSGSFVEIRHELVDVWDGVCAFGRQSPLLPDVSREESFREGSDQRFGPELAGEPKVLDTVGNRVVYTS